MTPRRAEPGPRRAAAGLGERLRRSGEALRRVARPSVLYLPFLISYACYYLLVWPITLLDTDLWFHLSNGRYIVQHGVLPQDTYFSFLAPARPMLDYTWLFQLCIFGVHRLAGYPGLLVFRTLVYLATTLLISRLLLAGPKEPATRAYRVGIAAVCAALLLLRDENIRPHALTYLGIVAAISLFDRGPSCAWLLPVLGVAWANLHGVEYPVLWLICGAYGLEAAVAALRGRATWRSARAVLAPAGLAAAAVLLTPHGLRLLSAPWSAVSPSLMGYVEELTPLDPLDAASVHVSGLVPSGRTLVALVFAAVVCAAFAAAQARRARVSHLVLLAGGVALLSKGNRFTYELMLLALPFLRAHPFLRADVLARGLGLTYRVALGLGMYALVLFLDTTHLYRPAWPLSRSDLPVGTSAFLNQVDAPGPVLNPPNLGGFLRWGVAPRPICMDMELPPFSVRDLELVTGVFGNEEAFRKFTRRYRPAFVAAPLGFRRFAKIIPSFPEYVPVMFDEAYVLYADAGQHPGVAEPHRLRALDPYALADSRPEKILALPDRAAVEADAERVRGFDPAGSQVNRLLALFAYDSGAYDRTLAFADTLIRAYPDWAPGYELKGDALRGQGKLAEALEQYDAALRSRGALRRRVRRMIGAIHLARGEDRRAYQALRKAVELVAPATPPADLYALAAAAMLAGDAERAAAALDQLALRLPEDAPDWAGRMAHARGVLAVVERGARPSPADADRLRRMVDLEAYPRTPPDDAGP